MTLRSLKQVGALPVRRAGDGSLEVMLVTSRETGRWIIPKGWPSKRLKDAKAAAREAKEEAGVSGTITADAVGVYRYRKIEPDRSHLVDVAVYLLAVDKERRHWPEEAERTRAWFKVQAAARKVREPRLVALIREIESLLGTLPGKPAKRLRRPRKAVPKHNGASRPVIAKRRAAHS